MLLLWSRLAALALVASLATGSPVSPSPLKVLDNGLSLEPAPRNEQLTNVKKRGVSVSPALDFTRPSILTRDVSHLDPLAKRRRPRPRPRPRLPLLTPPPIVYPWGGETYRPGDTVTYRWPPTHAPAKANLWLTCHGITGGETTTGIIAFDIPLYRGGTTTTIPIDLPSWLLTDDKGVNVNVSAFFYFGVSRDHYFKDPGVFGNHTHSFIIKNN
ncbi:BZ3500_MvSof-1268-A1-R1_Chr5-2g07757 [Microbotryum saponariae]|uniref:BZ3500_MvSof-1268-A1-R1_Chr5-2g07757 protein n=1 Tax=Microbotryum saponariae TaxID=289078 RepID=A0A2X0MDQ4_9BASI|nr:BZ3500_MvSof-1268-A1-R1_Chr5-2g07757 [Microbotryum saponariae]SDA05626.1 BZ3501_MvSof-1269-A2-R1_Chr5-2g07579 [Microbotryum saponariae]